MSFHPPKPNTHDAMLAKTREALFSVEPAMREFMARKGLLRGTGCIGETGYVRPSGEVK